MSPVKYDPTSERDIRGSRPQGPKGVFAVEKRRHQRYSIEFPLDYSRVEGKTTYNGGLTADASEGGLLVYLPEKIEIGTLLRIEIFYTKDLTFQTITAITKVVWSDIASKNRYGLEFQSIDEGNFSKLKTLLREVAKTHG